MPLVDLCITQGDAKPYNLTFKVGETPLDITGATVTFTAKKLTSDTEPVLEVIVTNHTAPTQGKTTISLSPTKTNIDLGHYYYDIQIVGPSIPKKTVLKGKLDITWQVTE